MSYEYCTEEDEDLYIGFNRFPSISSFPEDPTTIANIIDEFNFDHQVIIDT